MSLPTTDELAAKAPALTASLTELQNWMAELIRHKRGLARSEAMQAAAAMHFSGNDRLSPAEQINIYRTQFWLRHTNVLIDDFPGLSTLLGQKAWEKVAESYLTEVAFDVFALRDLARQMPEHLAQMPDVPHRELCIDMARLEWAYEDAFDAEDDGKLDLEKLQGLPPDAWATVRFSTSHSLRLLQVDFDVAALRRAWKAAPGSINRENPASPSPQNLVIYRRQGTLFDKSLSLSAYLLLKRLHEGKPLILACEATIAEYPEAETVFDAELSSWFSLWGRLGWITDVVS